MLFLTIKLQSGMETTTIITLISGGLGGALLTNLWNKYNNKKQIMYCHLLYEEIISKIPVAEKGAQKNIHTKEFRLTNTTNKDIESFIIIFEFDADAKILKQDTFCKLGKNKIKPKNAKQNEVQFRIRKFNRKDEIKFFFDIADITKNHYNVTEGDCLGFAIKVKVKKKKGENIGSKIVTKDKL